MSTSYQFFVDCIDQLDLAVDQLAVKDRNFDRFAIMLIDNIVELALHRYVTAKVRRDELLTRIGGESELVPKLASEAMGQNFDPKVRFAVNAGLIRAKVGESLRHLHGFRNTSYHRGHRHDGILHSLAIFYFLNACDVLLEFDEGGYSFSSADIASHRARKYLGNRKGHFADDDIFKAGIHRLREVGDSLERALIRDLAIDMLRTIDSADESIQFVVNNSVAVDRDSMVVSAQAWRVAFSDEGKRFAARNGCKEKTVGAFVEWIKVHYPWKTAKDPIASWKHRCASLSSEKDEHKGLKKYCDFLNQTETLRTDISNSAVALDEHIQMEIDRARGK